MEKYDCGGHIKVTHMGTTCLNAVLMVSDDLQILKLLGSWGSLGLTVFLQALYYQTWYHHQFREWNLLVAYTINSSLHYQF